MAKKIVRSPFTYLIASALFFALAFLLQEPRRLEMRVPKSA